MHLLKLGEEQYKNDIKLEGDARELVQLFCGVIRKILVGVCVNYYQLLNGLLLMMHRSKLMCRSEGILFSIFLVKSFSWSLFLEIRKCWQVPYSKHLQRVVSFGKKTDLSERESRFLFFFEACSIRRVFLKMITSFEVGIKIGNMVRRGINN